MHIFLFSSFLHHHIFSALDFPRRVFRGFSSDLSKRFLIPMSAKCSFMFVIVCYYRVYPVYSSIVKGGCIKLTYNNINKAIGF